MDRELRRMCSEPHDIVVIGGGVVGGMIAWDAALRGLKVALIERDDFAAGASSHNSKIIHGGLNQLESLHFALVREFIAERRIWSLIAPHLTRPMPFLLPSYKGNIGSTLRTWLGLRLHDLLAFDRDLVLDPDLQLPGPQRISPAKVRALAPFIPTEHLAAAYLYYECQMRFPERLVIELLRGALGHGARVANYVEATGLLIKDGAVTGIQVVDRLNNWRGSVQAPIVISATGPWTPNLLKNAAQPDLRNMGWVRGVHILTDAIHCDCAIRLPLDPKHLGKGSVVFSRWRGMTLIGTLNTTIPTLDSANSSSRPSKAEVDALIARANEALGGNVLNTDNVCHAFAALRPIESESNGKTPHRSSSWKTSWEIINHADLKEPERLNGMISVVSGNWTRARSIAERVVDIAAKTTATRTGKKPKPCRTRFTALWGGEVWRMRLFRKAATLRHPEIAPGILRNLVNAYGSRYREVVALASADDRFWARLDPARPEIAAQVIYAVRREWARNLDDVIYRRIGIGQTGQPSEIAINAAADLMAAELEWSPAERARQIANAIAAYQIAP